MTGLTHAVRAALFIMVAALSSLAAHAHSASDAYLTLTQTPHTTSAGHSPSVVIHGQWDIALRDLDFILKLDDNGDGSIVWGELRSHQQAIAQYAYQYLTASGDGKSCRLSPTGQLVDDHSDGAYASLMFDITCSNLPRRLRLDYRLFFAIDPSHRAIVVLRSGDNVATALLSSDMMQLDFAL